MTTKNRKLAPPKLDVYEQFTLEGCIYMDDISFKAIILKTCRHIAMIARIISKGEAISFDIYGVDLVFSDTKLPCVGSLYMRHGNRLYQAGNIVLMLEIIDVIVKDEKRMLHELEIEERREARRASKRRQLN